MLRTSLRPYAAFPPNDAQAKPDTRFWLAPAWEMRAKIPPMDGEAKGEMPENIFLVGMMGAGKTSVGRTLARKLGKTFYDSDQVIEARTGVRIPVIFELEGEEGFRAREAAVIEELTGLRGIVLATGGGAVLMESNRQRLRTRGVVVYLRASVNELWSRTRHDRNRPLLNTPDPLARLRDLHAQRDPLYRETAHVVVDTGTQSVKLLVQRLERQLLAAARDAGQGPDASASASLDSPR